jgi:serine/threonine protein kinase/formylglycine-generating enzyme required for sulfatase activity
MQVVCPWCQRTVEVPDGPAEPGCCPDCGRSLAPLHSTHLAPPGEETIADPLPGCPGDEQQPRHLGRYRITARLGSGGFGVVYKGYDGELRRDVAIKVPHRHRLTSPQDADVYLTEARVLASLDHPGIVPVYDVGRTDDGLCYLVSKFIEGQDLATQLRAAKIGQDEAARIIASVAEALHHAHERGLVHRDIKPGNILLDCDGRTYVADFGLALREEDFAQGPTFAGTPMYMSPEQARSEGHRVDGRTDIFSLGVVFYQALTGKLPFQGQTVGELLEQISTREAQPPRQLDPTIPPELERVCLKALSKRAADRYTTSLELAEDLRHWLSGVGNAECGVRNEESGIPGDSSIPHSAFGTPHLKVVPKGLRPFDAGDSDFFLELLPGPRDREGLPATIRFWKARIESDEPANSFAVGLVYGPSGCGKSSLVRAGLLPRLAPRVTAVYAEAAQEGTDRRVLGGLWHACPDLVGEMDLAAVVGDLRRGKALEAGRKLLIVIDQFEQFLHGQGDRLAASPLVAALRQADGVRVQFLLSVRDDFWLAASRLFQELEIPLVERRNLELIDLFEPKHARHVLQLFGEAHVCLPADPAGMTAEQGAFLDEAVAGLTEEGKVVPVHLSLFAEMMKHRPWTPQSLKAGGGTQGVGLAFLQETFSARTARPDRRAFEPAARAVLAALLPEAGSNIKGRVRSQAELLAASGLHTQPRRFDRLLELLDQELRIITPTEAAGDPALPVEPAKDAAAEGGQGQYYQLTHDFLVPPLREWLTKRRRETWRGRAELRLEQRAAQWTRSGREERFLPDPFEYARILLGVPLGRRRPEERALMGAASRRYALMTALLLAAAGMIVWFLWDRNGRIQATRLVETIADAQPSELSDIIKNELPRYRRWANPRLHALADRDSVPPFPGRRLRASLALVEVDPRQVDYLSRRLLDCSMEEFALVCAACGGHADHCTPFLWEVLRDLGRPARERFRAGMALAQLVPPDSGTWTEADADFLIKHLLESNPAEQHELRTYLQPLGGRLQEPLQRRFRDPKVKAGARLAAADALADFAGDRPVLLAPLVSEATPEQYHVLEMALEKFTDRAQALLALRSLVHEQPATDATEEQRVQAGRRRAGAAITLLHLGDRPAACEVFHIQDDPEALTQFVHGLKDRGVSPQQIVDCFEHAAADPARFALVLALGEFRPDELPEPHREPVKAQLLRWYESDPSSAIHGACGWLLRTWGFRDEVARVDRTPLPYDPTGKRDWFVERVGPDCITFIVFAPGTFVLGSPDGEAPRQKNEQHHRVRLTRPFAVADRELTHGQFARLVKDTGRKFPDLDEGNPTPEHPAVGVTWAEAVLYCRWLTQQAGLGEAGQCYPPPFGLETGKDGLPRDWPLNPQRPGFRLPTEAEWEVACRAGTTTAYSFGSDRTLLKHYGLFLGTAAQAAGSLRPNLRGLFDMHGNAWEWCQDWYAGQLPHEADDPQGPAAGDYRVLRGGGWDRSAWHCRSAYRHHPTPDYRASYMGFRLVRTLPGGH